MTMKIPILILTGKEAEKFAKAIKNPPKANKALKEILKDVKKRDNWYESLKKYYYDSGRRIAKKYLKWLKTRSTK